MHPAPAALAQGRAWMEEMALQESLFWHSSIWNYAHMHPICTLQSSSQDRRLNEMPMPLSAVLAGFWAVGLAPGTRGAEAAEAFSSAELLAEVARIRLQTQKPDTAFVWLPHLAMHRCLTAQRPKGDSIKAGPVVLGCSSTPMQLHPLSLM